MSKSTGQARTRRTVAVTSITALLLTGAAGAAFAAAKSTPNPNGVIPAQQNKGNHYGWDKDKSTPDPTSSSPTSTPTSTTSAPAPTSTTSAPTTPATSDPTVTQTATSEPTSTTSVPTETPTSEPTTAAPSPTDTPSVPAVDPAERLAALDAATSLQPEAVMDGAYFVAGALRDGTLVANRWGNLQLANTTTRTWRWTPVPLSGWNNKALATDGVTIWAGVGANVVTVDPATGASTVLATLPNDVTALAYDATTGKLYALALSDDHLYQVLADGTLVASSSEQFGYTSFAVSGSHGFFYSSGTLDRRDIETGSYEAITAYPSYSSIGSTQNMTVSVIGSYAYLADPSGTHLVRIPVDAQPNPALWPWTGTQAPDYLGPFQDLVSDGTALHSPIWTGTELYATSGNNGSIFRLVPQS